MNLREIRDIKFGTRGPLMYNDLFYGTDLEIFAYGSFSIQIGDPVRFICNFVPANVTYYSFDDQRARSQILVVLQSFTVALNALSTQYRISQLPAQAKVYIAVKVANDRQMRVRGRQGSVSISSKSVSTSIQFSDASRELVQVLRQQDGSEGV